ncbi:aminotransferase class I/II-fold pyridoxal phosphate-dependent enzyme [Marinobacter sp.]|uniref:aminotransferase class I/II-fold pyridoxal phosphate-dependent enzyme n=1 Tax=Marinobacter sp. TaxID=50741 RepID=UPI003A8C96EC
MFEALKQLPQDPILQLMQMFRYDIRSDKVDLGIGVYKDDEGNTPIMTAVHEAERRLLEGETTKSYVGPAGAAGFNDAMARLIMGDSNSLIRDGRTSVIQTPGGCGALSIRSRSCPSYIWRIRASAKASRKMPPAHGAAIVEIILDDNVLRAEWQLELGGMCARILSLRHAFADYLMAQKEAR